MTAIVVVALVVLGWASYYAGRRWERASYLRHGLRRRR